MNQVIQRVLAQLMAGGGKAVKEAGGVADEAMKNLPYNSLYVATDGSNDELMGTSQADSKSIPVEELLRNNASRSFGKGDGEELSPEDMKAFAEAALAARGKDSQGLAGAWNPAELALMGGAPGLLKGLLGSLAARSAAPLAAGVSKGLAQVLPADIASYYAGEDAIELARNLAGSHGGGHSPSNESIMAALGVGSPTMYADK